MNNMISNALVYYLSFLRSSYLLTMCCHQVVAFLSQILHNHCDLQSRHSDANATMLAIHSYFCHGYCYCLTNMNKNDKIFSNSRQFLSEYIKLLFSDFLGEPEKTLLQILNGYQRVNSEFQTKNRQLLEKSI